MPAKCLTPSIEGVESDRGEEVSIGNTVAEIATPETQFFGVKVCTSKESKRMINITFYLKNSDSDALIEMP